MTTNQEGRQAAIRDSTSTAYGVAADWHALFDDAGISAGTFNERLLAWINAELSASHSNLVSAMQAYAEDAGYDGWEDMATLVLAMNGAETLLDGETQGLAFDFTDQSALIIDTGTPANNYDSTGIVSSGSLVGPSGKLVYTNASNKLTLQSDGFLRYQAHNLFVRSSDFSSASWGVSGTTKDAGTDTLTLTLNAGTSAKYLLQTVTLVAGAPYTVEYEIKAGTHSYVQFVNDGSANSFANFDVSTGAIGTYGSGVVSAPSITAMGDGWYLCRVTWSGANTYGTSQRLYGVTSASATYAQTTASTGTFLVRNPHLFRYPANTEYVITEASAVYALPLEYSATDGSCLGLLVEEARTNVIPYSTTTAQWSVLNLTASANSTDVVDIFGLNGATKLTGSGGSAAHLYYPLATPSLSAATNYVCSIYVKAGTLQYIQLLLDGTPFGIEYANFDIQNGTATGSDSGTLVDYGIEDAGNGWYRLWIVDTSGSTAASPIMYVAPLLVGNETYNPTLDVDGLTFYVMQADCQAGSFPTSPILTYGAAASRLADNISIATSAFPYSATAGSWFAEFKFNHIGSGGLRILGGTSSIAPIFTQSAATALAAYYNTAAVAKTGLSSVDEVLTRATSTYDSTSGIKIAAQGAAPASDASTTFASFTALYLGSNGGTASFASNLYLTKVSYVPRVKSDAELQAETA